QADRSVPGRLWASLAGELTGGLVVRSDDRGATWATLLSSSRTVPTRALALAPGSPRTLAVGGGGGGRGSPRGGRAGPAGRRRGRRRPDLSRRRPDLDRDRPGSVRTTAGRIAGLRSDGP